MTFFVYDLKNNYKEYLNDKKNINQFKIFRTEKNSNNYIRKSLKKIFITKS